MTALHRRPGRRLVAHLVAALALVLGNAAATSDGDAEAAGTFRPGWTLGLGGTDIQHNETLVSDRA